MRKIIRALLSVVLSYGLISTSCLPALAEDEIMEEEMVEEVIEEQTVEEEEEELETIEVENEIEGDFYYRNAQDGVYITGYAGSNSTVSIPSYITGSSVVGIDSKAFSDSNLIEKILIPDTINYIGKNAFYNLPNVDYIFFNAANCQDLSSGSMFAHIGNNVESCVLDFGDCVERIPMNLCNASAEGYDLHINYIELGSNIKSIGYMSLAYLYDLEYVFGWNKSLTSIEAYAFYMDLSLRSITIPEKVINVGYQAFGCLKGLEEINYNAGDCTTFAKNNFIYAGQNTKNVKLNIGNHVLCLPSYFLGIESTGSAVYSPYVREITMPRSVESIGTLAFQCMPYLEKVTFEGMSPTMAEDVFKNDTLTCYYDKAYEYSFLTYKQYGANSLTWKYYNLNPGVQIDPTLSSSYTTPNYPNKYDNFIKEENTLREFRFEGASQIELTISNDCDIENGYDFLYVYDRNRVEIYKLTGPYIAGETYTVYGDTVWLSFTSDNSETRTGCKVNIVPYYPDKNYDQYVKGYNISLAGDITMNYYVDSKYTSQILNNIYAEIYTEGNESKKTTVYGSYENSKSVGDHTYYIFSYGVPVKDMATPIHFKLYNGKTLLEEKVYSINEYASYIIEHPGNYDSTDVYISRTMLSYGFYAQRYFGYRTDSLPKYHQTLSSYGVYPTTNISVTNKNMEYIGVKLALKYKPSIYLYFKGNVPLYVNGKALPTHKDGVYTVYEINDIDSLYTNYTITGNGVSITYGLRSYLSKAKNSGKKELVDLADSMIAYYLSISAVG